MAREYSRRLFTATIDGTEYTFGCHTTNTRNGFCHTCYDYHGDRTSKVPYLNRTWESFEYETVLRRAIDKYPKNIREQLTKALIEKRVQQEREQAERDFQRFKQLHDGLTQQQKELLAQTPPMQTEEDMHSVMGIMGVMNVFNQLSK